MRTRLHTPPSSSYAYLPKQAFDININELARRIGLEDDPSSAGLPQSSPQQSQRPSPISTLPPEILAEIFTYCRPQEQFPVPCRTEAPLLLTHVSSHWRALALSIPDLWTALHINYKDPAEDIPAADLWLSRSGNRPLTLSVAIDFGEQPQQEILDALCRHSKRWKHIRFDFRHLFCPPMYTLDLAQDSIPNLRTFEFHARDISNTNVSPITRLLSSAPQLREVTWVDDLADTDTLLELPLSRLTRLSLAMDHGTLDYLQVLHQCANLEHIRITRPLSQMHLPRPPLFLCKLTSLNISYDLTYILDYLVLPALRDVRIYAEGEKHAHAQAHSYSQSQVQLHSQLPHAHAQTHNYLSSTPSTESWDPTAFLSLIDRSACGITSLSINSPMTEDTLLRCLRRTSLSLTRLYVEGITVGDALIGSLTLTRKKESGEGSGSGDDDHGGGCEPLCPKLEEISLDTRVACTQGILAAMVESRLTRVEADADYDDGPCRMTLRKIRVMDGHRDLERLKELHALSRCWDRSGGRWMAEGKFTVEVIPHNPAAKQHTRNLFFRRKLCASR